MKKYSLCLFFLLLFSAVSAQNDSINFIIQRNHFSRPQCSLRDNNGNFYIAGSLYGTSIIPYEGFLAKIDSIGNLIFYKQVPNNQFGSENISSILLTKENNIVVGGYAKGCDVMYTNYFLECWDDSGNFIYDYSNFFSEFKTNFANTIIELPDSNLLLTMDSSLIILHQGQLISTFTYHSGSVNKLLRLSNGSLLIACGNQIIKTDSLYNPTDTLVIASAITSIKSLNDSSIYLTDQGSIYKINSNLAVLNSTGVLSSLDFKFIDNQVWLTAWNNVFLKMDLNLSNIQTIIVDSTMDTATKIGEVYADSNKYYFIGSEQNHLLLKSFNKTNNQTHRFGNDAALVASRVDSSYGGHNFFGGADKAGDFYLTVKNEGSIFIDSVWIFAELGWGGPFCQQNLFSQKYLVALQPGDSSELHIGWVYTSSMSFFNYNILDICFTVTAPNNTFDENHKNDSLCSVTSISHFTNIKNAQENNTISIYPNPSNKDIRIQSLSSSFTELKIEILDCLGKTALVKNIQNSSEAVFVDFLDAGIYFYKISKNGTLIKSGKLSIEK